MTTFTIISANGRRLMSTDEHGARAEMERHGLRHSELQGHLQDLRDGHTLTADDGTGFRLTTLTPAAHLCGRVYSDEHADAVCTAPASHAGDCAWVDTMGLTGVDSVTGLPVYRPSFNHAR